MEVSTVEGRRYPLPMDELAEIKRQMAEQGITQADVGRLLRLSSSQTSKSFNGGRRFTVAEMDALRAHLSLHREPANDLAPARGVPIIGLVAAGNWREAVRHSRASLPSPDPSLPPNAVALVVEGDSMNLLVDDGQVVVVDPDDRSLFDGRYYVVVNGSGEATFKQFKAEPARLVPCSTNPAHQEIPVGEPFEIVGRVIWRAAKM